MEAIGAAGPLPEQSTSRRAVRGRTISQTAGGMRSMCRVIRTVGTISVDVAYAHPARALDPRTEPEGVDPPTDSEMEAMFPWCSPFQAQAAASNASGPRKTPPAERGFLESPLPDSNRRPFLTMAGWPRFGESTGSKDGCKVVKTVNRRLSAASCNDRHLRYPLSTRAPDGSSCRTERPSRKQLRRSA